MREGIITKTNYIKLFLGSADGNSNGLAHRWRYPIHIPGRRVVVSHGGWGNSFNAEGHQTRKHEMS